jgi:hypothetical protein
MCTHGYISQEGRAVKPPRRGEQGAQASKAVAALTFKPDCRAEAECRCQIMMACSMEAIVINARAAWTLFRHVSNRRGFFEVTF